MQAEAEEHCKMAGHLFGSSDSPGASCAFLQFFAMPGYGQGSSLADRSAQIGSVWHEEQGRENSRDDDAVEGSCWTWLKGCWLSKVLVVFLLIAGCALLHHLYITQQIIWTLTEAVEESTNTFATIAEILDRDL